MKAIIRTEINCGECGSLMQYHKESTVVRCNQLKCKQRHVDYRAPTITLIKENEVPLTAFAISQVNEEFYREVKDEFESRWDKVQEDVIQPMIDKLEGIVKASQPEKKKRGPKPKTATD